MKPNLKLLVAIKEKGMTQLAFARQVGDHHTFVRRVVNGWINLDENRKCRYAEILGKQKKEIFE